MNRKEIENLLESYRNGQCTTAELALLEDQIFNAAGKPVFNEQEINQVKDEISANLAGLIRPSVPSKKSVRLWPRIAGIAAAVTFIIIGLYFFNYRKDGILGQVQEKMVMNDVAPGKMGATLTLANGKTIRLSDAVHGEIAKEAGVSVTKTAEGQLAYEVKDVKRGEQGANKINILSTARGEQYLVKLPDGSVVYLNAESSLKYPASFANLKQRKVQLTGEGYFEIFKDRAHPFIVLTEKQQVEVLGTHFNINSYADEESTKTTLLEGSVKIAVLTPFNNPGKLQVEKILKPGQQASVSGADRIKVEEVNTEEETAWKNGEFMFNNENLETVMRKVSRWYNVAIVFTDPTIKSELVFGIVSRYDHISKLLNVLERTGKMRFEVEGRKISIYRK